MEELLKSLYYNKEGAPGAWQGASKLFKAARKVRKDIRYDHVLNFISNVETHQRHFDDTQRTRRDPLRSKAKRQWHVGQLGWIGLDTMFMAQGLGSPFPYLMIGVDLFSGKVSV